ncbi:MAG: sulfatase-like hydrolase/transferase [Candidatus Zixiibacteriota bacterium]|nr:MAG: sulfatase-like hydrolase/transferase [candidate division Zixibacteria bacterium]
MKFNRAKDRPLWRSWLPPRPVILILGIYIAAMVFFSLLRLVFFFNFSHLAQDEQVSRVAQAFLIGLRFDQIIVLISLLPVTLAAFWIRLDLSAARKTVLAYLTAVFAIHFLLLLADIRFYHYFDSHLNFLAVEYIGEGAMFGNLITSDPQFFPSIFIWMVMVVLFVLALMLIFWLARNIPRRRSWTNHVVYLVVLLAVMGLGIRGRISLAPMDWGLAYFSENRFLNQLALNGIYTLGRNLSENNRDPRLVYLPETQRFTFVELPDALKTVKEMLGTTRDRWLDPERSVQRLTEQPATKYGFQPNLVIILSESWTARLTGALSRSRYLTPNFDRLADHGILFENFYASGMRTNYGIPATFCSFPSLPGRAIMKRYNANHPFVSLSEILSNRGYLNAFVYGGDLAFDNMEGFLREKKFRAFYGDEELGTDLYFSKWGIPDHVLLEKAAALIDTFSRPFQLTVLTLSNHEPWDLPDSTVRRYLDDEDTSKIFNSQVYADFSLGRFFELVERKPAFDSTIFVFLSDHGRYRPTPLALDIRFFHVPLLIYSPVLLGDSGRVVSAFGSQTDILPTIMGLLGGNYTLASWGRDLLNLPDGDGGFAVMNVAERIAYIDKDYLYMEELGGLAGYGTRVSGEIEKSWFGFATLQQADILGRGHTHQRWREVMFNCLDKTYRFAVEHALNRIISLGPGHLLIQALEHPDNKTSDDKEPPGLIWSRERLHHFMQAADQLSTPE